MDPRESMDWKIVLTITWRFGRNLRIFKMNYPMGETKEFLRHAQTVLDGPEETQGTEGLEELEHDGSVNFRIHGQHFRDEVDRNFQKVGHDDDEIEDVPEIPEVVLLVQGDLAASLNYKNTNDDRVRNYEWVG